MRLGCVLLLRSKFLFGLCYCGFCQGRREADGDKRYCYGMQLPPEIMRSGDLKRLCGETNIIISTSVSAYERLLHC